MVIITFTVIVLIIVIIISVVIFVVHVVGTVNFWKNVFRKCKLKTICKRKTSTTRPST